MNEYDLLMYLENNFNIDGSFSRLVSCIFRHLESKCVSLEGYYDGTKEHLIRSFVFDLVDMLNNSDIDVTIEELIENKIVIDYN